MSKSLRRISAFLEDAGIDADILEMPGETRTAADAAREAGCEIDQIAKSIIFRGEESGACVLFITAGGNQVDPVRATELAGEPLARADAGFVREATGFAIGGVAPVAHKLAPHPFFDPRLMNFAQVFAAAGTPRHIFRIAPADLQRLADAEIASFTSS
ncbi:MAG: YbaK/EbsC family protein [Paracoccaceae bacterium]|nr:YbaK/EbsC family protein [Paracoccaceae bacterium]